jgi:hypothetical protein
LRHCPELRGYVQNRTGIVWKRFSRLSRSAVFEAFLQLLAETSKTARVVQFFDSTVVRAYGLGAGEVPSAGAACRCCWWV